MENGKDLERRQDADSIIAALKVSGGDLKAAAEKIGIAHADFVRQVDAARVCWSPQLGWNVLPAPEDDKGAALSREERRAREVLGEALRQKYPQDGQLDDMQIIAKYGAKKHLVRLTDYYAKLQKSHDRLDKILLNAG